MTNLIHVIEKTIQSMNDDVATGHDWYHIDCVRKNALYLQSKEGEKKM